MFRPALALAAAAVLALSAACSARHKPAKQDKPEQSKKEQSNGAEGQVPKLSVEEFDEKRKEKDTVVIDVRTPDEYKAGHVPGAVNINVTDEAFDEKVAALDQGKTYLVYCAIGRRSARATERMKTRLDKLYDFSGGMTAWQKAGKPVEK